MEGHNKIMQPILSECRTKPHWDKTPLGQNPTGQNPTGTKPHWDKTPLGQNPTFMHICVFN